jgi:uncharacterized membrane-anchored protein YhcB (DUF1043 family)
LVAENDRVGLSPMDFVAVLTKVVQDQDRLIANQQEILRKQKDQLESQKECLEQIFSRLAELESERDR